MPDKPGLFRVVVEIGNRAVQDALYRFVDSVQRDNKPLPRPDWMSKTVMDNEVELRALEDAMEKVLEPRPVDAGQPVGRHNFHVRQKVGGVMYRIGDASFDLSPCNPNLVNQFAVFGHVGVTGQAAQHIDRAAFDVIVLPDVTEQRPGIGVGNAATCIFNDAYPKDKGKQSRPVPIAELQEKKVKTAKGTKTAKAGPVPSKKPDADNQDALANSEKPGFFSYWHGKETTTLNN